MSDNELTNLEKLEIMEKHMRLDWSDIDELLTDKCYNPEGDRASTRDAYGAIWASNKWHLYKMMGDRLSIQKKVLNSASNDDIGKSFSSFLDEITSSNDIDNSTSLLLIKYFRNFSLKDIRDNKIPENLEFDGMKFNKGQKISRGLKQFIKNKNLLDLTQTLFSKFIQELDASGTLELSIDPLDIIMSSVNSDGRWRSCHNVYDGEYGSGSISYAIDGSTMIAQIYNKRDDNDIALKLWRQLVWIDTERNFAALSRQYPSTNKNNAIALGNLFKEEIFNEARVGFVDSSPISNLMHNYGGCHYNDITHGHLSKVRVITLNDKYADLIGSEKDNEEETIRPIFRSGRIDDITFEIGVRDVPSADGGMAYLDEYDSGHCLSGAVYDEG